MQKCHHVNTRQHIRNLLKGHSVAIILVCRESFKLTMLNILTDRWVEEGWKEEIGKKIIVQNNKTVQIDKIVKAGAGHCFCTLSPDYLGTVSC